MKPGIEDTHLWQLSSSGQYSAKSTYKGFLQGLIQFRPWEHIWKSWAPGKCCFFIWTVMHKRCCTADCLVRQGLPHLERRFHCDREEGTIDQLLAGCVFARLVILASKCYHLLLEMCPLMNGGAFVSEATNDLLQQGLNSLFKGLGLLDTSESLCV